VVVVAGIGSKTLNAGQFNSLYKGTSLVRVHLNSEGKQVRVHNKIILQTDNAKGAVTIFKTSINLAPNKTN
jgi:hypothetical protein